VGRPFIPVPVSVAGATRVAEIRCATVLCGYGPGHLFGWVGPLPPVTSPVELTR
jgi:hypothetical protein